MKITTFCISKNKQIYAKILTAPENTLKIKAMLPWIFLKFWLTLAVIYKQ